VPAAAVAGCFGAGNERPPGDAMRLTSAEIDRVTAAIPMGAAAATRYSEGGMREMPSETGLHTLTQPIGI
jgi:hypothetical protein